MVREARLHDLGSQLVADFVTLSLGVDIIGCDRIHLMELAVSNWQRCVFKRCESCGKRRDPTVRHLGEWRPCFVERYPR